MLRLASDADVHGNIVRGLRRRLPEIDVVRVQVAFPIGAPDSTILEWAAAEKRVLISNDRRTMIYFATDRLQSGKEMPGLILTSHWQSVGAAIDDLEIICVCATEEYMQHISVIYLPL